MLPLLVLSAVHCATAGVVYGDAAPAAAWLWHNDTSCEWTPQFLLPAVPGCALAQCQALCVANERCLFINHADPPGNLACELYSACAKPFCRHSIGKWWSTYQLTSRNSTAIPRCAAGPPG